MRAHSALVRKKLCDRDSSSAFRLNRPHIRCLAGQNPYGIDRAIDDSGIEAEKEPFVGLRQESHDASPTKR
jgi:hypothetical protein